MARPKQPGYRTCWLVYRALAGGERNFKELKQITKLHDETLCYVLKYLVDHKKVWKMQPLKGHVSYTEVIKDGKVIERREKIETRDGRERVYSLRFDAREWPFFYFKGSTVVIPEEDSWFALLMKPSKTVRQRMRRWQKSGKLQQIRDARSARKRSVECLHETPEYQELAGLNKDLLEMIGNFRIVMPEHKELADMNLALLFKLGPRPLGRLLGMHKKSMLCPDCFRDGKICVVRETRAGWITCRRCGLEIRRVIKLVRPAPFSPFAPPIRRVGEARL